MLIKKKFLAVCIAAAAAMTALSFNAYADGSAVCIRSADTPESADEYARDRFEHESKGRGLIILGLTITEAKSAYLGAGFRVNNLDGSARDNIYYYPIMCGDQMKLMVTVIATAGEYSCGIGKNAFSENIGRLKTSLDNPMEIYVSDNSFYLLTDNNELHFSEGYPYSEKTAQKELEEIKKLRAGGGSPKGSVVCYGSFEKGLVTAGGKTFFVNDDGTLASGWKTVGNKKYYFRKSGEAITKSSSINGVRYSFGKDGVCAGTYTGWTRSGGNRYYFLDGLKQTGWCKINDGWHYLDEKTGANTTGTVELYGKSYTFSDSGVWDGHADVDYSSPYFSLEKKLPKDASGGVYVNDGVLVVMTKDREKVFPVVEKARETYAPIVMRDCKFSTDELEEVRAYLENNMIKYGLNTLGTYVMSNSVGITTEKVTDELQDYINSLDDPNIISVVFGGPVIPDSGDVED